MVAVLLSLAIGVGLCLLFDTLTRPLPLTATRSPRVQRMETWLLQAGVQGIAPRDFLLVSLGIGLICGLVAHLFLGWVVLSLFAAGVGSVTPFLVYVARRDRRRAVLSAALVEAITQLRDGIRSGLSVQDGFAGVARHGPVALRAEFSLLVREAEILGFQRAIEDTQRRLADPVFDLVATALRLNDRLGGRHVTALLDRLAHATREEQRVQAELRAIRGKNVLSARIVAAVPLLLLVVLRALNPTYVAVFDTTRGQLWLAGCVASVLGGYMAMLGISRMPDDERVLHVPDEA